MTDAPRTPPPENSLLAALPREDYDRLVRRTDEVTLDYGELVYRANGPIEHVLFPRTGILSMVIDMEDGATVEVGTVGREGLAGLPVLHGTDRSPTRVYCQVPPCVCRRLPADVFAAEVRRPGPLQTLAHRYAQALMNQTSQSTACNRLHPVEARLARWLLMTRDRVDDDTFQLTHEVLAEMLGVRRASVTVAAGALQKAGLVRYTRGRMTVRDRVRLEAAACECYRVVRAEFDRLLG